MNDRELSSTVLLGNDNLGRRVYVLGNWQENDSRNVLGHPSSGIPGSLATDFCLNFIDPRGILETFIVIQNAKFPAAGEYRLQLQAGAETWPETKSAL